MIARLTLALIALQAAFVVATDPIAPHLLIVVESGAEAVVSLKGYDLDGDTLVASVDTISLGSGKLYQLSKVYSSYGYEPKQGASLTGGTVVTGSKNRASALACAILSLVLVAEQTQSLSAPFEPR